MGFRCGIVAILGRPNVGKSTLLNALVGQKIAAVASKPQTTRQQIRGIQQLKSSQVIYLDTPGYHRSKKPLNLYMLEQVKQAAQDADIVVIVLSVDEPWDDRDEELYKKLTHLRATLIVVLNKIDQIKKQKLLPLIDRISHRYPDIPVIPIAALAKDGLQQLEEVICERLPEGPPLFPADQPTDQSLRVLATEIIREKLFEATQEEIPYSLAVVIESFQEPRKSGEPTRIGALIFVEKKSQKPIVIGKGGAMLKRVGCEARQDLEELCQNKVFLSLHVKVAKDWTKKPQRRREFGYA